jgi:hypothetical protein
MRSRNHASSRWVFLIPAVAALLLGAGCREVPTEEAVSEPYRLETVEGSDISRVILEASAAERLAVQTASVERDGNRLIVPAAAVLYDPQGGEWVYTSPEPLVFVRHPITVDRFERDVAVLSDGPPVGTEVVEVGVSELYGAEFGVG